MLSHGDFETEREFMEYCAARHIWNRKNELTPNARIPWWKWYAMKFGRTLEEAKREYLAKMDR